MTIGSVAKDGDVLLVADDDPFAIFYPEMAPPYADALPDLAGVAGAPCAK